LQITVTQYKDTTKHKTKELLDLGSCQNSILRCIPHLTATVVELKHCISREMGNMDHRLTDSVTTNKMSGANVLHLFLHKADI